MDDDKLNARATHRSDQSWAWLCDERRRIRMAKISLRGATADDDAFVRMVMRIVGAKIAQDREDAKAADNG